MKKIALLLIVIAISAMLASDTMAQRRRVRAGIRYGVGPGYRTPGYRYGYRYSYGPYYDPGYRYRYGPYQRYDYRYEPGPDYRYGYRYGYGPGFRYGAWYPYHHHRRFYYGWNPSWWSVPGAWALNSRWWRWNTPDTYAYYNPYADYLQDSFYDYNAPVCLYRSETTDSTDDSLSSTEGGVSTQVDQSATASPAEQEAMQFFQKARTAFKNGDYSTAMREIDQAIDKFPKDAAFHEFRGLVLFAQGKYNQAAGVLNSVLASGPGWSWSTMINLYSDPEDYTKQLRDLEAFVRQNKEDAAAKFLLAYEYLVMGHTKNAVAQLKSVVELQPKDVLSKRLLNMLETPQKTQGQPSPQQPSPQE